MASKKGNEPSLGDELKKLQETMSSLPDGVADKVGKSVAEALRRANEEALKAADNDDDEEDDPDIDVERMSRKDFMSHVLKQFDKSLKRSLKGLETKVEKTSSQAEEDRLRREYEKAAEKYPDFMDWRDEISAKIKKNPAVVHLDPGDLYHAVRGEHPDKAKELDAKYSSDDDNKGQKDSDDDSKGNKSDSDKPKPFTGFSPSSKSSVSDDTEDDDGDEEEQEKSSKQTPKKSPQKLAEEAWDETMKDFEAAVSGGG